MRIARRAPASSPPTITPTGSFGSRDAVLALLQEAVRIRASEIHMKAPGPCIVRIDGVRTPFGPRALTPIDARNVANILAELGGRDTMLTSGVEAEFSFGIPGVGRFHTTLYQQRGSLAAILHPVAMTPPTLESVGGLPSLVDLLEPGKLVGLLGAQRVEWLHALLNEWNQTRNGYIVSIERPLRYLHRDAQSSIAQRETGQDVRDTAAGIRLAARLGADLITVSDLTEGEAVAAAIEATERGLTVLAAIDATRADVAVDWITLRLPPGYREENRPWIERALVPVLCVRR